jgi:hypothetical protein
MLNEVGCVSLHALGGELPLLGCEEPGRTRSSREHEEGNGGDQTCQRSLDDEEVLPVVEASTLDVENAICWRQSLLLARSIKHEIVAQITGSYKWHRQMHRQWRIVHRRWQFEWRGRISDKRRIGTKRRSGRSRLQEVLLVGEHRSRRLRM